jgi:hypothetical protein
MPNVTIFTHRQIQSSDSCSTRLVREHRGRCGLTLEGRQDDKEEIAHKIYRVLSELCHRHSLIRRDINMHPYTDSSITWDITLSGLLKSSLLCAFCSVRHVSPKRRSIFTGLHCAMCSEDWTVHNQGCESLKF